MIQIFAQILAHSRLKSLIRYCQLYNLLYNIHVQPVCVCMFNFVDENL